MSRNETPARPHLFPRHGWTGRRPPRPSSRFHATLGPQLGPQKPERDAEQ